VALFEVGRNGAEAVLAPRRDDQIKAFGREHVGKRRTDARRGAGDKCGPCLP
jgi:hypothetical protein